MTEPYWSDGTVSIYHAKAEELPLTDESVACIVTSPPYNVGLDYGAGIADDRPVHDYQHDARLWSLEMARVLATPGRCWVNVAPVVAGQPEPGRKGTKTSRHVLLGTWLDALEMEAGLDVWDIVAWTSMRGAGTAWGSWRSPSAPNMRGGWEAVIAAYKGSWGRRAPEEMHGWRDTLDEQEGSKATDWQSLCNNHWTYPPQPRRKDGHPAPFPESLAAHAIRLSTWPGEVVLDPFMGTGATLLAARALGRKAVGIEMSEQWCERAARRLDDSPTLPLVVSTVDAPDEAAS